MRPKRIEPGPGQESVWDYPRPPRLEPTPLLIRITCNGQVVAETSRALRLLETSHPPTYYLPRADVRAEYLVPRARSSWCEFKGGARYVDVVVNGQRAESAGWYYPDPLTPYEAMKDHLAFYAAVMDACTVDGELVVPQAGGFYGGWITSKVVGPFKGEPGSWGW